MNASLSEQVGRRLKALGLTVATAESCTGGLVGSLLTDVPGSSEYYRGGVVAYSNEAKSALLGVRTETLAREGAVSEAAVREMAFGARVRLGASIGLAVSGIAGPGGAVEGKPVGTVWLALVSESGERTRRLALGGGRLENKAGAAAGLLALLDEYLASLPADG